MKQSIRVCLFVSTMLFWAVLALYAEDNARAKVSGTLFLLRDKHARLGGTKVVFRPTDGTAVEVVSNQVGEYEAFLKEGKDYTVSLVSHGLCNIHRPLFRVKYGAVLRFDFTTTFGQNIGLVLEQSSVHPYPTNELPFCDEEAVPLGKSHERSLVLGFGMYSKDGTTSRYDGLPVTGKSGSRLPVTISFDTHTIRADTVLLDRKARVLRAEGNVSTADGTAAAPQAASCVMLRLSDVYPHPQPCLSKRRVPSLK